MHKTGTSSIQETLSGYEDKNYVYPHLIKGPNHSAALMTTFSYVASSQYGLFRSNPNDKTKPSKERAVELIRKELILWIEKAKKNRKNLIFSAEDLFRINQDAFDEFINFFEKYVDEFIFVIYIREPKSWMRSALLQRIKVGADNAGINVTPSYVDYEKYVNADCNKKIIFREFSRKKLFKEDAVSDFFNLFELKQPKSIIQSNISPNLELIKCRYFLTDKIIMSSNHKLKAALDRFSTFVNELKLDESDLDKELFAPICSIIKHDIAWAEKITIAGSSETALKKL